MVDEASQVPGCRESLGHGFQWQERWPSILQDGVLPLKSHAVKSRLLLQE